MMTPEEALADMEKKFQELNEEEKETPVLMVDDKPMSPKDLLEEVRKGTEFGKEYALAWAENQEDQASLEDLLGELLSEEDPSKMN
jgi:hypothetical protein